MIIPRTDVELSISIAWIILIELKHKPTGLIGYGSADNNSRRAYALALHDLENKLASTS